jgi:hypothetical protein
MDMASTTSSRGLRGIGLVVIVAGAVFFVAGVVTYAVVSRELADQRITVSSDAAMFAGQQVTQPWQAYSEAMTIQKHATEIAGGKTYAELPQNDPSRTSLMTASFLQASLFTSVVAFGVAAMAAVVGVVFVLIGVALRRIAVPVPAAAAPEATQSASAA